METHHYYNIIRHTYTRNMLVPRYCINVYIFILVSPLFELRSSTIVLVSQQHWKYNYWGRYSCTKHFVWLDIITNCSMLLRWTKRTFSVFILLNYFALVFQLNVSFNPGVIIITIILRLLLYHYYNFNSSNSTRCYPRAQQII